MASIYGEPERGFLDSLPPARKEKERKEKDKERKRKGKKRKRKGTSILFFVDLSFDSNTAGKGPAVPFLKKYFSTRYCT